MPPNPEGPHDLEGLDAFMQLLLPLEEIFVALYEYREQYESALRPCEQEGVKQAIVSLARTINDMQNRP